MSVSSPPCAPSSQVVGAHWPSMHASPESAHSVVAVQSGQVPSPWTQVSTEVPSQRVSPTAQASGQGSDVSEPASVSPPTSEPTTSAPPMSSLISPFLDYVMPPARQHAASSNASNYSIGSVAPPRRFPPTENLIRN